MRSCVRYHRYILKTGSIKVVIVCMLLYSIIPLNTSQAIELCGKWDTIDVLGGEYRIYNNVWGATTAQCFTAYPDSTYFSITTSEHNQSGGVPASYPFILKGSHFGGTPTSKNNPLPIQVPNVGSAPFTWSINTASANGIWNAALDIWFVEGSANKLEMMIWIDYEGGCQPAGSKQTTVSIGGYTWDVWWNGSSVLSYKITSVQNSISLDIKDFMDDAVSCGYLNTAWDLGAFEAGFEIWRDGEGLTTNSFSASAYDDGWLYGDLIRDNIVNLADLYEFCLIWLDTDCVNYRMLDLNLDCIINFYEFSLFAQKWLDSSNRPPTVNITSPSDSAVFGAPANITINASASDSDGSITKVEFYEGSNKLGEDTTSPYSYAWNNVSAGSYSLTAKATDNEGATTTSSAVNITVAEAGCLMEAEDMTLTNYTVNTNSSASGGELIKLSGSGVTGSATYNFSGTTGTYNIKVYYYDENDGVCTLRLYVAGVKVDEWIANQNLGSSLPVAATRTSRTKTGVPIANGDQIKLEAVQHSSEWGRFDNVQIAN